MIFRTPRNIFKNLRQFGPTRASFQYRCTEIPLLLRVLLKRALCVPEFGAPPASAATKDASWATSFERNSATFAVASSIASAALRNSTAVASLAAPFFAVASYSARRVAAKSDRELLFFFRFLELVFCHLSPRLQVPPKTVTPCSAVTLGTRTRVMARWLGVAWELNSIT